jgi:putative integral membrane protein (TIGR02587 family)
VTSERYAVGLARAFGGAIIFGIPLLMTMEMWSLGFSMGRGRLLLLMGFTLVLLIGLSYFSGFEKTFSLKEDAMDAFAAFGVGVITSAMLLVALAVITFDMSWGDIVGRVSLQSVPASIGRPVVLLQQCHHVLCRFPSDLAHKNRQSRSSCT